MSNWVRALAFSALALLSSGSLAQTPKSPLSDTFNQARGEVAVYLERTRELIAEDYTIEQVQSADKPLTFRITVRNLEKAIANDESVLEIIVDAETFVVVGENRIE